MAEFGFDVNFLFIAGLFLFFSFFVAVVLIIRFSNKRVVKKIAEIEDNIAKIGGMMQEFKSKKAEEAQKETEKSKSNSISVATDMTKLVREEIKDVKEDLVKARDELIKAEEEIKKGVEEAVKVKEEKIEAGKKPAIVEPELKKKSDIRIENVSPYIEGNGLRIEVLLDNMGGVGGNARIKLICSGKEIHSGKKKDVPAKAGERIVEHIENIQPGKVDLIILSDKSFKYELDIPDERKEGKRLFAKRLKVG